MTRPSFLMLGHGYSAAALAARLPDWRVLGTTRTPGAAFGPRRGGGRMGRRRGDGRGRSPAAEAILVSIPPADGRDPALQRYGQALGKARAKWVGYLSATAVYGDRQGGWVDETSALEPVTERGRWRVAAEAAWAASGLPVQIFRLAGIYGPGRSPLDRLREGRAHRVVKAGADVQPHPRGRHRGGAPRLHGAAGSRAGLQPRRRPAGAATGRDRLCRGTPRTAGAAGGAVRGGGAFAHGAELLRRVEAGGERAGQGGTRGSGSPIPTIAPAFGPSSRPGAEGIGQQPGSNLTRFAFRTGNRRHDRPKISASRG